MKKEGQWDPQREMYHTKERQLQERTQLFMDLHRTLKYSPSSAYMVQGDDMSFEYPNSPKALLVKHRTQRPTDLSNADPHPKNISRKHAQAEQNKQQRLRSAAGREDPNVTALESDLLEVTSTLTREGTPTTMSIASNASATTSGAGSAAMALRKSKLQRFGLNSATTTGSTVRGGGVYSRSYGRVSYSIGSLSAPLANTSSVNQSRRSTRQQPFPVLNATQVSNASSASASVLPEIHLDDPAFSSTLMQLRRTKGLVVKHNSEISTLKTIMEMQGSADLKRTITKMFADPKRAEDISNDEHDRRERLYEEDRKRNLQHQADLLKEERESMEKELAHFN